MLSPFREPESRIDDDRLPVDPRFLHGQDLRSELGQYFSGHVRIDRTLVGRHVRHPATRVHQHKARARSRRNYRHLRVESHRRYIIDYVSALFERCRRHAGLRRVDGNWYLGPPLAYRLYHWEHTSDLILRRHRSRAWSRRFPADVDDVRPLFDHHPCMIEGCVERQKITPVAEAVGGKVQDSHDDGMIQQNLPRTGPPEPERLGGGPIAKRPHAGAGSGPPKSGGFAGFAAGTSVSFDGSAGAEGGVERGGSCSPRASFCTSSPVSVSRSSSAAATRWSRSRFSVRVSFARLYASLITRETSESTSCAVRSETYRRVRSPRPRKSSCSLSPTRIGPMASDSPHCPTYRRASDVACWISLAAPVVTRLRPNTSSSATRPPYMRTRCASSCSRVIDTRSSSGRVNASPSARPRGTIVTLCSGSLPRVLIVQTACPPS